LIGINHVSLVFWQPAKRNLIINKPSPASPFLWVIKTIPKWMHGRFILFGFKGEPFKADPMAHPAQVSSLAARLSEMQSESGESAAQSAAEAAAEVRGLHWIFTPQPLGPWGVYTPSKYINIYISRSRNSFYTKCLFGSLGGIPKHVSSMSPRGRTF